MDRIDFVAEMLRNEPRVNSLLDVGCRDGRLKTQLSTSVEYTGADLTQNSAGTVGYVGDITTIEIDRDFDCVVACDILEHVESPATLLKKISARSRQITIVSLPNCFDLKSRYSFAAKGRLGGKYLFAFPEPFDRHRWLVNLPQAEAFLSAFAASEKLSIEFRYLRYGDAESKSGRSRLAYRIGRSLPAPLAVHTVFAILRPSAPDR